MCDSHPHPPIGEDPVHYLGSAHTVGAFQIVGDHVVGPDVAGAA